MLLVQWPITVELTVFCDFTWKEPLRVKTALVMPCDQLELKAGLVCVPTFNSNTLMKWIMSRVFITKVKPIHLVNGNSWGAITADLMMRMNEEDAFTHADLHNERNHFWNGLPSVKRHPFFCFNTKVTSLPHKQQARYFNPEWIQLSGNL